MTMETWAPGDVPMDVSVHARSTFMGLLQEFSHDADAVYGSLLSSLCKILMNGSGWKKKEKCRGCLFSETPVFSLLMSCLLDPLLQSDSLRLFMRESPAPLQTSFQYGGWRGIKREEGRGKRGERHKNRALQKTLKNRA